MIMQLIYEFIAERKLCKNQVSAFMNSCLFAQPVNPLKRRFPLSEMEVNCPEKRIRELAEKFENSAKIQRPKVCIRCLNGEGGHITHHLEPLPMEIEWPQNK